MRPLRVFISYAHSDDKLRQALVKHLSFLRRDHLLQDWWDRRISPGDDWQAALDARLEEADVVLLLISAAFVDSAYCVQREMQRALELHGMGRTRIIPILLRPCDWRHSDLATLQALPANGFPVTSRHWKNQDEAFAAITAGLRDVAHAIQQRHATIDSSSPVLRPPPPLGDSDRRFVDDVHDLYRLFGYRVARLADPSMLLCHLMLRGAPQMTLVVHCVHTPDAVPPVPSHVTRTAEGVSTAQTLVLVLRNSPPQTLREAHHSTHTRLVSYDELFDDLLNLNGLLDSYRSDYEHKHIYSTYIPLSGIAHSLRPQDTYSTARPRDTAHLQDPSRIALDAPPRVNSATADSQPASVGDGDEFVLTAYNPDVMGDRFEDRDVEDDEDIDADEHSNATDEALDDTPVPHDSTSMGPSTGYMVTPTPISTVVTSWLASQEHLLIIFGDFGSGKTTVLERIKYDLATEFRTNRHSFIPVLIPLRDFDSFGPLDAFIESRLHSELDIRLPLSRLGPLLRERQFVFLLDGFDEIAAASSRDRRRRAFTKLLPLLLLAEKCILTCRTSYFVDDSEFTQLLHSMREVYAPHISRGSQRFTARYSRFTQSAGTWVSTIDAALPADYRYSAFSLCGFSTSDIDHYVANAAPAEQAPRLRDRIRTTYDLEDLATRPVLLDLIVKTLPLLPDGRDASPAVIYDTYTGSWLNRDYGKGDIRTLISAGQKLAFMRHLAWHMYRTNSPSVHYSALEPRVNAFFDSSAIDAEALATDIQTCSFLVRDSMGGFRFTHKSFMEYFVASQLRDEYRATHLSAFADVDISYEVAFFLGDMIHLDSELSSAFLDDFRVLLASASGLTPSSLIANSLRVFGCSRLRCDGLVADDTAWLDIRASMVSISGDFRRQRWDRVSFQRSSVTSSVFRGLAARSSRLEKCVLTSVEMHDVVNDGKDGTFAPADPFDIVGSRWTHGQLNGSVNVRAVGGTWIDVNASVDAGRLVTDGLHWTNSTVELNRGAIALRDGQCDGLTLRGIPSAAGLSRRAPHALADTWIRRTAEITFERTTFSRTLFSFIDFSELELMGCSFTDCIFVGCLFNNLRAVERLSSLTRGGCRFASLVVRYSGEMEAMVASSDGSGHRSKTGRPTNVDAFLAHSALKRRPPALTPRRIMFVRSLLTSDAKLATEPHAPLRGALCALQLTVSELL